MGLFLSFYFFVLFFCFVFLFCFFFLFFYLGLVGCGRESHIQLGSGSIRRSAASGYLTKQGDVHGTVVIDMSIGEETTIATTRMQPSSFCFVFMMTCIDISVAVIMTYSLLNSIYHSGRVDRDHSAEIREQHILWSSLQRVWTDLISYIIFYHIIIHNAMCHIIFRMWSTKLPPPVFLVLTSCQFLCLFHFPLLR